MTKLLFRWVITRVKVNIRSISFWLMTVLMALALILTRRVIGQYSADTVVLLYASDAGGSLYGSDAGGSLYGSDAGGSLYASDAGGSDELSYGEWCCRYLVEHTPDGFAYEYADSEEQLISRVSTGDVSCGVSFGSDAVATIYQTAGSMDGYVVREMVYPVIAEYRYADELAEYVRGLYPALSEDVISGRADEAASYITERYRDHMDELDLKIYEIRDIGEDGPEAGLTAETDTDTEAGVMDEVGKVTGAGRLERLVFVILLIGICGLIIYDMVYTDKAFYRAFSAGKRIVLAGAQVLTTNVMLIGFAVIITLAVSR